TLSADWLAGPVGGLKTVERKTQVWPGLKTRTAGSARGSGGALSGAGEAPRKLSPERANPPCGTSGISTKRVAEPRRSLVLSATTARICQTPGPGIFI